MLIVLHEKYPLFLSDFNEAGIFRSGFSQNTQISKFMNVRPVGAEFFRADRRTSDRHDEANGRFSRFGERVLTWLQGRIYERLLCCRYDQLNCVTQCTFIFFYIQGSVHREIYANNCPTRCNYIQFIYTCKPLYMFQVVSPPIIRSSCHCIYSIWH